MKNKKEEVLEEVNSFARIQKLRDKINKKAGTDTAFDLTKKNPTEVNQWISTGSRWLDSIICRGKVAGIPVGKCSELAGVEASGKSYMAMQIAINAMKMGIDVVYFDSESSVDPKFLQKMGIKLEDLIYIQATTCEFVLETIEEMLKINEKPMLFIWDSLANTPTKKEIEADFDPLQSIAEKARILAIGLQKLTLPIANHGSTWLVVNQLKTNITNSIAEKFTDPLLAPGGKALNYGYSLRIWLTPRKAKADFVKDEEGETIGIEISAKIKKSRFGSFGRECEFQIMWGGDSIGILDKESWLEVVKRSPHFSSGGPWMTIKNEDNTEFKFQSSQWMEKLNDEKFYNRVIQLMDEVLLK